MFILTQTLNSERNLVKPLNMAFIKLRKMFETDVKT